jgi:cytochrome c551/c552
MKVSPAMKPFPVAAAAVLLLLASGCDRVVGQEGPTAFDPADWRGESAASASAHEDDRLRRLAGERGCTLCHRAAPPRETDAGTPLAPSWREIAARYRGRADAETALTRIIIAGADPSDRHWKNRLDFAAMQGNQPRVTPDEARALVRWILSSP